MIYNVINDSYCDLHYSIYTEVSGPQMDQIISMAYLFWHVQDYYFKAH